MSVRQSIIIALADKLKTISILNGYKTDLYEQAFPILKFWDEIQMQPAIFMSAGPESREYHPGGFKWGFLNVSLKIYVKGEDPAQMLENLLEDVEKVIDANRGLVYNTTTNAQTVEISINSIITDEGLLNPYGVGEINIVVQYPVL